MCKAKVEAAAPKRLPLVLGLNKHTIITKSM